MNETVGYCNPTIPGVSLVAARPLENQYVTPEDASEGERLSDIMPAKFQAYMDRWVRFWPKKSFIIKHSYDRPWYYKKRKNKNDYLPLYPDLAVEWVERHLDHQQWLEWKCRQEPTRVLRAEDFWLGLMMPRMTTVSDIDIDAKDFQVGSYRRGQYHQVKQTNPVRPVMFLPIAHLKKINAIYDHFPGRIWCVSSETLGLHAWIVYDHPKATLAVHRATKQELASIGLGNIEVHPMPGRGQRRPFGQGYVTITPEGPLTTWWDQAHYFEKDRRTPSFTQIVRVLLALMMEQWRLWRLNDPSEAVKLTEVQHHLADAELWLEAGCPDDAQQGTPDLISRGSSAKTTPRSANNTSDAVGHLVPAAMPAAHFDLDNPRHGNWPKELARLAQDGLDVAKSLHIVCYEMAKYLYWYELYDLPEEERQLEIIRLLKVFAGTKHNGLSERIN